MEMVILKSVLRSITLLVPDHLLVLGDNHCGYIGFRKPFSDSLIDDGLMNVVVSDWTKP
jgi:hypothetical protein